MSDDGILQKIPNTSSILGEGAIWDSQAGVLYWVDILAHKVNIFNPSDNTHKTFQLDQMVGTIVPRKSGGAMVALHKGFATFDLKTGEYSIISNPETDAGIRFNDGKCDPQGRFWAGTMEIAETGPALGSLYMLDADKKVHKKLSDVGVSNGICWSADQKTMYFIDSPTKKVDSFAFDPATGDISNRQTIITIPEGDGYPDGMTIDRDGNLWVAHWEGYKVTQWDPKTGKLLRSIRIPVAKVTSLAFGGPDLKDLYVTTASKGDAHPAGALFRIEDLKVRGVPSFSYSG